MNTPHSALRTPHFNLLHFPSITSTNDHLKSLIDAPEFTCVTADEQTAGRGRYARAWVSQPGEGLSLSVLLRPASNASHVALISLLAAVAVAETLQQCKVANVDIKWPNDVLIGERKACGILAESVSSGVQPLRVILGIGVNLNQTAFPDEISATATSVRMATGQMVALDAFRDQLLERLAHWYGIWQSGATHEILTRWQALSSYAQGQTVSALLGDEVCEGVTAGLGADGSLRLQLADGTTRDIRSGEISRLRKRPMNIE